MLEGQPRRETEPLPKRVPEAEYSRNPERRERQIEAVQDIRDRHGILMISCQPDAVLERISMQRDDEREWFRDGLGLPPGTDRLKTIRAAEDALPDTVPESGIIVGGSAHSTYEDLPWMRRLKVFLREMARMGKPILGVCFGQQLVAEAFGGKVAPNPSGQEVGLINIDLTDSGEQDPLFEGMPTDFDIYAYHSDIVTETPDFPGTAVLARNGMTPYQALAVGDRVRGVQFHPEIGEKRIRSRLAQNRQSLIDGQIMTEAEYLQMMEDLKDSDFDTVRKQLLGNFDRNFVVRFAQGK